MSPCAAVRETLPVPCPLCDERMDLLVGEPIICPRCQQRWNWPRLLEALVAGRSPVTRTLAPHGLSPTVIRTGNHW
jgi:hypothetical protein